MTSTRYFEHRSVIPATVDQVYAFHEHPAALRKLSMPPVFIRVRADRRKSLIEGEISFVMWVGPVPVPWVARHEPGPLGTSFADRMVTGPMRSWRHEHIFAPHAEGTELIDRITFSHHAGLQGIFTRLFFDGLPLRVLFRYRHWRTLSAVRSGY